MSELYRKVLVPVSQDGEVKEERFVRCESCYSAVAEMFVSKAAYDQLERSNKELREALKALRGHDCAYSRGLAIAALSAADANKGKENDR